MPEQQMQIPAPHQEVLAWLVAQPSDTLKEYLAALESEALSASVLDLANGVAAHFPDAPEAGGAVGMLVSMAFSLAQMPGDAGDFASFLVKSGAVQKALKTEASADAKKERVEILRDFFRHALESPAIALHLKATELRLAQERILHNAVVLTDLRPVFTEDLEGPNVGFILHTLRLMYGTQAGQSEILVGVSRDDLEALVRSCNRALAKENRLRNELDGWLLVEAVGFSEGRSEG